MLLPIHKVIELTSLSRATIYRMVAVNAFPAPVKISERRVAWRQADIDAWAASAGQT